MYVESNYYKANITSLLFWTVALSMKSKLTWRWLLAIWVAMNGIKMAIQMKWTIMFQLGR